MCDINNSGVGTEEILRAEIMGAFAFTSYPGDENIVAAPMTPFECEETFDKFVGKTWQTLVANVTSRNERQAYSDMIHYLEAYALAYYLPAFMMFTISESEDERSSAGRLVFTLTPAEQEQDDRLPILEQVLTNVQKQAILNYALYLKAHPGTRSGLIDQLVDYWRQQAAPE